MKNSQSAITNQKINHAFIRLSMVVAGIITAIIISLTLIETPHLEKGEPVSRVIEVSSITATDFSMHLAGKVVASLWPF